MKHKKTFNEQCYELLKKVPAGKVTTYKALAHKLGTRAYRAVGNAMNKNPNPGFSVPCHRVVNSNGKLGGYAGSEEVKKELLENEGIRIKKGTIQDFETVYFDTF